ncbi:MAG: M15 family metallopeptidase [Acidobacteriota bacterium]|nr:MAG: M15 family metallopeptidase [Acidobacteriota bacterium]
MRLTRSLAFRFPLLVLLSLAWGCSSTVERQPSSEEQFQIVPVRPIEQLRTEALEAEPPVESADLAPPDLVELSSLDSRFQLDIRYATDRNFMGTPFYSLPRAYLQRSAAQALLSAHRDLLKKGFGLMIFDAYRPWFVTKMFWDATPEELRLFVADPSQGSRHNRGCAVDLTLYDLSTGNPVPMPSGYDEFTERAHIDYVGGTARERANRQLLRETMERHGFAVFEPEWWHYDFQGWEQYAISNIPFEQLP